HAFMKHEWFECWINNFGSNDRLLVHTAWDGSELVGIAPLRIVRRRFRGVPLSVLTFLQSSITPRCNFIVRDTLDLPAFFDSIIALRGWSLMEVKSLDEKQTTTQKFIEYLTGRHNFMIEPGIQSPYEVLPCDWASYYASRSKHLQRDIRASGNRSKSAPSIEVLRLENRSQIQEHFPDLLSISQRSWKAGTGTDLVTDRQSAGFLRQFCELGADQGLCLIYILMIEGKAVAFDYYVRHRNRLAGLRWEYDDNYNYYIPGLLLHCSVLKELIGSGEPWEYDLTGDITKFKADISKDIRKHVNIVVGRPGVYGSLLMRLKKASQHLRSTPPAQPVAD
ncbi:MAG: GNAT family N-acetyltransferase, partial [Candidatus Micrarchaeota archaeon]